MTNEEGIRYCDEYLARNISDIDKEFLKIAKEALQQQFCDKCVYSTSEGCQYDDITETIPPFEDCISRQAVLDSIHANCVYENEYNLTAKHIEDAVKQLPPVNPQIICPIHGVYCEDCSAYEKKLNKWIGAEVLDEIRNEITMLHIFNRKNVIEIIDKYKAESEEKE